MVHRGKLSAACKPCRSRRLKCDQQKPSCSQCIRAKRECSGYRDVGAIRVHNQTEEVKRKVSSCAPSPSPPSPPPLSQRRRVDEYGALVRQQPSLPINDQGTAFVIARYLTRDGPSEARGPVGLFLPHVSNTPSGRAVMASLNAVGLAALSNIYMSPKLGVSARQEYITALAETNAALGDPIQATSDASVIAVIFLSMYEIMTCNGPPLMDKFLNHVEGCTKLLELRGTDQLKTSVGLGLFSQFRMTILLGNLWLKRPTPSFLIDLSKESLACCGEKSRMGDELFFHLARVGDLCAGLRNGAVIDPVKVVKEALKLDAELSSWAMEVEPERRYTVVDFPESTNAVNAYASFRLIYGSQYHVYPDTIVSSCWNDYRLSRLILLELICVLCDHLARKDGPTGAEYRQTVARSTTLSRQLCEDICASVPYHLGATQTSPAEDLSSSRTGGVLRLIWPLFIAADCAGASPEMVEWISQCLFRIGHGVGIQQALVMSGSLRAGLHLTWLPELGK
ncbi:Zn(II)2Cys6 transcription factor [Aspergillus lucknowensis]|uniref:Zn(2)-C6 fungal-type domain-containing protein n=1 Tax=Aspergillus lucknowensis TaxID=176173 RepID=A0ABR4M8C8_9EURO